MNDFNKELLAELYDIDPEVLDDVIDTYIEELPVNLGAVLTAIQSKNTDALNKAAHKLKGGSATLGLCAVANKCLELEILGKNDELTNAETIFEELEDLLVEAQAHLRIINANPAQELA